MSNQNVKIRFGLVRGPWGSFMFDHLMPDLHRAVADNRPFSILYIGCCFQDDFLGGLLDNIKGVEGLRSLKIEFLTLLNTGSEHVSGLEVFERQMLGDTNGWGPQFHFSTAKKPIDLDYDFTEALRDGAGLVRSFDLICCFFELHFCLNWRVGTTHLLAHLNPGGGFAFAEVCGEHGLLDGNFRDVEVAKSSPISPEIEHFRNFIKEFDQKRAEKHLWLPEISLSNYRELRNQLGPFFAGMEQGEYMGLSDLKLDFDEEEREGSVSLKRFMEMGKHSYFHVGIRSFEVMDMVGTMKNLKLPLSMGAQGRLYLAHGFLPTKFERAHSRIWDFRPLLKDLGSINDNKIEKLGRKAMDVLLSHDVLLPSHTYYCATVSWEEGKDEWNYPIHILFNNKLFNAHPLTELAKATPESQLLRRFCRLMQWEKAAGISMLEVLFKRMPRPFPITFQLRPDNREGHFGKLPDRFDITEDPDRPECWYGFFTDHDTKGKVLKLTIAFSRSLAARARAERDCLPPIELGGREEDVRFVKRRPIKLHPFATRLAFEQEIEEIVPKADYENGPAADSFATGWLPRPERIVALLDIHAWQPSRRPGPKTMTLERQAEVLFALVIRFTLMEENTEIAFLPSAFIETKKDRTEGLGGLVLYEKTRLDDDPKPLHSLAGARNRALAEASNLIFQKASIASHIGLDFRNFALQAAVSSINSRSGSHGQGSHVLPWVIGNEKTQRRERTLLRYLQHKFDFIAQASIELPHWTGTVWFARDLMADFFRQEAILEGLTNAEGLGAYHFGQGLEKDWFAPGIAAPKAGETLVAYAYGRVGDGTPGQHLDLFENRAGAISGAPENKRIRCFLRPEKAWPIGFEPNDHRLKLKGKCAPSRSPGVLFELHGAELIESTVMIKVNKRAFITFPASGQVEKGDQSQFTRDAINVTRWQGGPVGGAVKYFWGIIERFEPPLAGAHFGRLWLLCKQNFEVCLAEGQWEKLGTLALPTLQSVRLTVEAGPDLRSPHAMRALSLPLVGAVIREVVEQVHIIGPSMNGEVSNGRLAADVQVAIPGGIVGFQAFFSLIENVLRNTAKHNWVRLPKAFRAGRNMEVKIEIENALDPYFFACKIWNTVSDLRTVNSVPGADRLPGFALDDPKALHNRLNGFLRERILDKNWNLRRENLGMSEMKICAAFLAMADWLRDSSVLDGENVLIEDGEKKHEHIKGYLRAAPVFESEGGELVPRLGYRFKLPKPKELLLVTDRAGTHGCPMFGPDDESRNTFEVTCTGHKLAAEWQEKGMLNYEFCVFFEDETAPANGFASRVLNLLDSLSSIPDDVSMLFEQPGDIAVGNGQTSIGRQWEAILQEIEELPYRLFVVYKDSRLTEPWYDNVENVLRKPWWLCFLHDTRELARLDVHKYRIFRFLKSRIFFISEQDFGEMANNGLPGVPNLSRVEVLKLRLYDTWLTLFESETLLYELKIRAESYPDRNPEDGELITTLPPALQPFGQKTGEEEIEGDFNRRFINEGLRVNKKPVPKMPDPIPGRVIQYYRHEFFGKGLNDPTPKLYSESLSGDKSSFALFSNPAKQGTYNRFKFIFQLFETAYQTALILDERLLGFVKKKQAEHVAAPTTMESPMEKWQSLNLVVPLYCANGPIVFFERAATESELAAVALGHSEEKSISIGKATIKFLLPWFTAKVPSSAMHISTVIIHQTFLEDMAQDLVSQGTLQDCVAEFVRQLKVTIGIPCAIITSGRGGSGQRTSKLAKYQPFSSISNPLLRPNPDRILFTQVIFNSQNKHF